MLDHHVGLVEGKEVSAVLYLFVGIDIAKDTLDMDSASEQPVRLPHDAQGITEATKRWARRRSAWSCSRRPGASRPRWPPRSWPLGAVAVVNPRQVRDYAKATAVAKTDRVDALVLADSPARYVPSCVRWRMHSRGSLTIWYPQAPARGDAGSKSLRLGRCLEGAGEEPEAPHRLAGQAHRGDRDRFEAAVTCKPRLACEI